MSGTQLGLMAAAAVFLFAGMQGIVLVMRSGENEAALWHARAGRSGREVQP